jgi:hypothetical protein
VCLVAHVGHDLAGRIRVQHSAQGTCAIEEHRQHHRDACTLTGLTVQIDQLRTASKPSQPKSAASH